MTHNYVRYWCLHFQFSSVFYISASEGTLHKNKTIQSDHIFYLFLVIKSSLVYYSNLFKCFTANETQQIVGSRCFIFSHSKHVRSDSGEKKKTTTLVNRKNQNLAQCERPSSTTGCGSEKTADTQKYNFSKTCPLVLSRLSWSLMGTYGGGMFSSEETNKQTASFLVPDKQCFEFTSSSDLLMHLQRLLSFHTPKHHLSVITAKRYMKVWRYVDF